MPDTGKEMRVVRCEGPAQRRIVDLAEEVHAFRRRHRHVVHLGKNGLPVQILQKQENPAFSGIIGDPLQPVDRRLHPDFPAGSEVIAAMDDDPFGPKPWCQIDIGLHIGVHRVAAERRDLGDIHPDNVCRPKLMPLVSRIAHGGAAGIVECFKRVWRDIGLRVDNLDAILRRPADAILKRQPPPEITPIRCFNVLPAMHSPLISVVRLLISFR